MCAIETVAEISQVSDMGNKFLLVTPDGKQQDPEATGDWGGGSVGKSTCCTKMKISVWIAAPT